MSLFKGRTQPLVRYVGVDLRRGERGVPKDLLHAPQVRAPLQQMGRHRMPKPVRAKIWCPSGQLKRTMNHPAHHAGIDPLATLTDEHGLARLRRHQLKP